MFVYRTFRNVEIHGVGLPESYSKAFHHCVSLSMQRARAVAWSAGPGKKVNVDARHPGRQPRSRSRFEEEIIRFPVCSVRGLGSGGPGPAWRRNDGER